MSDKVLKIGSGKWTGYEPFYLAEKTGIFEKNGAKIEIVRNIDDEGAIKNLQLGYIDGATLTLDMLFMLQGTGFPVKAVLVMDYSIGGDMIIAGKGIISLDELVGLKIGMEKLYIGEYFLARSLAEKNLLTSDVNIINIGEDKFAEALEKGDVNAVVAHNPMATRLIQQGFDVIFSTRDIPSSIIDVLAFPEKIYNDNKGNIRNIVQSWFDTLRYIDLHRKESMAIMAESEGVSEYEFKVAFDDISIPDLKENIEFFNLESEKNIFKISDITLDFMMKKKMIQRRLDTSMIFDPSILKAVK